MTKRIVILQDQAETGESQYLGTLAIAGRVSHSQMVDVGLIVASLYEEFVFDREGGAIDCELKFAAYVTERLPQRTAVRCQLETDAAVWV